MFRKLIALEIEALKQQFDGLRDRVDGAEKGVAATARELLGLDREAAASHGIWTLRRPV